MFNTITELQHHSRGSRCSVAVQGNPMPFAVGELLVTVDEVIRAQGSGKLLAILHIFGDALHTRVAPSPVTPNEGFTPTVILPVSTSESLAESVSHLSISESPVTTSVEVESKGLSEEVSPSNDNSATMDELILRASLLCLRYIIKEQHLPMLVSSLWSLIQR